MKLTSFHIADYRCVNESNEVAVHPRVTCLVGKNESGKTALLEALRRVNPLRAAGFNLVQDYPRSRLREYEREQKRSGAPPATVVGAVFELDDDDIRAVEDGFGAGAVSRTVQLAAGYGPGPTHAIEVDESAVVAHLVAGSGREKQAHKYRTVAELHDALKAATEDDEAPGLASKVAPMLQKPLAELVWERVLQARTPQFMYFDEYSIMARQAQVAALADANQVTNN